ncbi:MAG: polysaccharide biosynthesis C-terminal domain-containing protein [Saprospiraceae bacterium]|nr:polysaccharide biosynthesis C-terminal domain-containing protein [Saprospiraceae bacterium]
MGVIRRQGLKYVILNYFGIGIGLISMLFIYPLETEAYGLARFLMDSAVLFIPLTTLGGIALPVRFFSKVEDNASGHHGFISWLLLLSLIGAGMMAMMAFAFWDRIINYYGSVSPIYVLYLYFFIPILIFRGAIQVLSMYISNFHRIVVPSLLNDLLIKASLPIFILLVHFGWWDYNALIIGVLVNFVFVFLGLLVYLHHLDHLSWRIDWSFFKGPLLREMGTYAGYGILGSMGASIAVNLDVFMIGSLLSPQATGIYGIAAIMASLINRPIVAITAIAGPIIMKALQKNDYQEVHSLYKKSSVNSFVAGSAIFLLIILNLDDIYALMPNSLLIGQNRDALFYLGLAYLFNLLTGANSEIIAYSNLFRWNFYGVLLLACVNLILNFMFIKQMGITGAALATLISFALYNLFKAIVIYWQYGMHPFTPGLIRMIGLTTLVYILFSILPLEGHFLLTLMIRTVLISLIFTLGIWYGQISEDIHSLLEKALSMIRKPNR